MHWTDEQLSAITSEGNLIVSAAAGAGKTAVLTERVVSRVAGGVPMDEMLVLTFTRAAAAEMKSRIANRLNALAEEAENPAQIRFLRRQARNTDGAYISTIHAFCARVLRRHYHAVGLPARARTADEMESAALMETVRDELLTMLATEENADYRVLLSVFGGEQPVWDAVMAAYRYTRAEPDPESWLTLAAGRYEDDAALEAILNDAVAFSQEEVALMMEPLTAARDSLSPEWATVIPALDDDLSRYRALLLHKNYDSYRSALRGIEYTVMRFPRGTADEEKKPVQAVRQAGKDLVKEQLKRFSREKQETLNVLRRSGEAVGALTRIVCRFEQTYRDAKRVSNIMDYDDLEHLTLEALRQEEIAKEYREKFRWIAVDEYQDSNRVQEAILGQICRGDNLFFVGDVKQSIYRFRQAEPGLFLEKLSAFSGERGSRVDLSSNFRSSKEVLAAVNEVFEAILNEASGGIDYDARARLLPGVDQPKGTAELHLICRNREENAGDAEEDPLEDAADLEVEARLIAHRIHEIMQGETCFDSSAGGARSYRYADFAVLLRAGTDAQVVSQTLSQQGIPCYAQSSGGYFDAIEVQIFKNLLSVIDNRRQDVALLSVLCSSIGGFTYEELANIRALHPEGSFFEAFVACAEAKIDALGSRANRFLLKLDRYRAESRILTVEALLGKLLDETGFYEEMGAGYGGAQRQANLNALLEKAHAYESSGRRGVWNFLRYIELARNSASVGAAQTVTADVVRILTIHKSKGLEFPVVFVAGLGKRFNQTDVNSSLQLHARFGIALRVIDNEGSYRVKRDTLARVVLSQRVRHEQLAEEMRILYVAMTRAKRKLILTACLNAPGEKYALAPRKPFVWQVLRSSCPVQWLIMGTHKALETQFHEREAFLAGSQPEIPERLPPFDPVVLAAIDERLSWTYAHVQAAMLRAKDAVSRIGKPEGAPPEFRVPAFLGEETSAVFTGTATHAAMQYLPLGHAMEGGAVDAYLSALRENGRISPEQEHAVDREAVAWFTNGDLYRRMSSAARLERELPFSYPISAQALYQIPADETVLLQGVIDACFLENGAWTIVDYKTDRIRPGESAQAAADRHAVQLDLYALALEAITGVKVEKRLVVLLSYRLVVAVSPGKATEIS